MNGLLHILMLALLRKKGVDADAGQVRQRRKQRPGAGRRRGRQGRCGTERHRPACRARTARGAGRRPALAGTAGIHLPARLCLGARAAAKSRRRWPAASPPTHSSTAICQGRARKAAYLDARRRATSESQLRRGRSGLGLHPEIPALCAAGRPGAAADRLPAGTQRRASDCSRRSCRSSRWWTCRPHAAREGCSRSKAGVPRGARARGRCQQSFPACCPPACRLRAWRGCRSCK